METLAMAVQRSCVVMWYGMVWHGVVWCGVAWYGVVWCGMVWYGVIWYGVAWCGVAAGGSLLIGPISITLTLAQLIPVKALADQCRQQPECRLLESERG